MKRRVEEYLLGGQGLEVGALSISLKMMPTVLQAPLDDNTPEKRALLDAARLFQTVSGIGCVHVNLHLYKVTNTHFSHLLRSVRARKLAEAGARTLSDIRNQSKLSDLLPASVQIALKYHTRLIEQIPRAKIEKIEALARPLLTNKGFEVHFAGS
jgi:hypothetical protein